MEPLLVSALVQVRRRLRELGDQPHNGTGLDRELLKRLQAIPPADTDTSLQ